MLWGHCDMIGEMGMAAASRLSVLPEASGYYTFNYSPSPAFTFFQITSAGAALLAFRSSPVGLASVRIDP